MPPMKLDGAGAAKYKTLEEALLQLQKLHGLVEQMALAVQQKKGGAIFGMQIRRAAAPLVGQLKVQFGMIADALSALILVATRGGNENQRVRACREMVAQLRTQMEMAMSKVKEQHGVEIEIAPE